MRTTCPRDCYDAYGALVRVRAGRIVHGRGDPEHAVSRGKLCRKCALAYNGRFAPVSWDEALSVVADRLGRLLDGAGETILYSHYTGSSPA